MRTGLRNSLILAAIVATFAYGYVAVLHSFWASYCHGIDNIACLENMGQFEADGKRVIVAYAAGYVVFAATAWAFVRWRRTKK